jgi:predicted transposase/invertase (TIGR01784 family)
MQEKYYLAAHFFHHHNTPMKTDFLFYNLFELEPALLLHLAHLDIPEAVLYRFQAIELKDTAKRTDAVLVPDTTDAPLIVAEVQFWKDASIYNRLVSESARLRLQMPEYQHLQMVLVFPSREIDPGAGVWQGLVEREIIRIVYLNEALEEQGNNNRPEERTALWLMNLTVSPHDEPNDRTKLPAFVHNVVATKNTALQKMFRNLFVSLYTSKYKHLTIQEVRAMINMTEIFDDIHESLAVQQYGDERVLQAKLESAVSMLQAGILIEQVASILNLPIEAIEEARKNMP